VQVCVIKEANDLKSAHIEHLQAVAVANANKTKTEDPDPPPSKPTLKIQCSDTGSGCGDGDAWCDLYRCSLLYGNVPANFAKTTDCATWDDHEGTGETARCKAACDVNLDALTGAGDAELSDKALALALGDKPSIGNLCGLATAITEDATHQKTIPGYCCLDTPAESTPWGRSVSAPPV
jgi:hypothetical protein